MPAELPHLTLSATTISYLPISKLGQPASVSSQCPVRRVRPAAGWLLTLLFLLLSGAATTALAQATPPPECSEDEKFANTWYFGSKAGLDFNQATDSIPPTTLTDGQMVAPAGAGVMSDGNGNILFYSNGDTIWNGDHTIMTNGTGLGGNITTTDGPLPIRLPGIVAPGQPTRYLIFTLNSTVGLSYSEIVIPAGGGPGTVVAATKNTPLARGTAEKLTGVFHKNGCDIWVIAHGWGDAKTGNDNRGDAFLAYRVRITGVDAAPIISPVGSLHALGVAPLGYRGQMKVTPDGEQLALARFSEAVDSSGTVELFNFDAETGDVSNPQIIDSGEGRYYGVEFSPSRSRLYATVLNPPKLLQFDISGTGPATKEVIPLNQTTPINLGSMQAAPDGKIYVARQNAPALGFIAYPDSLGASIAYADDSLALGERRSGLGLVNFNQSSLLRAGIGAQITACRQISFQASFAVQTPDLVYAWTFGDGTTSAEKDPVHVYATPGDYTVTLRITNDCFCRETRGLIRVPNLPEPGSIASPQTLCAGTAPDTLASTVNGSSDAGLPLVYQWESSTDNATFTAINGATGASYLPPNSLPPGTTYFRRRAQLLLPDGSGPYCTPSFTASVAITVTPELTAGTIAADQTVCAGAEIAPLTSTAPAAGGIGTFAYQWEASTTNGTTWGAIPGATNETFTPGPLTTTTLFRRQVTSGPCGPEVTPAITITILPALTAGTIAADQTICAGATPAPLTSTGEAEGTQTFAYQWEALTDNGTTWGAIPGATAADYAPGPLTATTLFRRQASSSSACAPVFSNVVTINVSPALTAGTIGADQTVCAGAPVASLTSTAPATGGTGTFAYQWESSGNNTNWTPIVGANGADYAPGPLALTTYFRRQVTSETCGSAFTPSVLVTVLPNLTAGTIAADQVLCVGAAPAPLTSLSEAGGAGNIVYQWESSADNGTWTPIGGATGPTYTPGPLTANTFFRRQASADGACAPVFTNVISITVLPALTAGTIGADQTVCPGDAPAALTSTAGPGGGTGSYSYQWESSGNNADWTPIVGATGAGYAPGVLTSITYYRRVVTSGACGSTVTPSVTVTVLPALTAGSIGANQTVCVGAPVTPLTSTVPAAGGTGAFAYQWEASTNNGTTWGAIPGATNETLTPGPLTTTTLFRRQVTSGTGTCSTGVSNVVTIQVQPVVTPGVTLAPPPVQCPGTPLTFTAVVTNAGPAPTFSWFVNNVAVASGPTFTSSTVVTGDQVRVEVTPTAGLCSAAPAAATVTVTRTPTPLPTLAITVQPGGPVCLGEPLTFSIANVTEAGPAPDYQWQVNGNDVTGARGPVFTSTTLREGQTVTLRLRTTNVCGQPVTAVSNGVAVRIQPPVDVDAGPDKEILAGTSVILEGRADGTYPVTWTPAVGLTFPANDPLRPVAAPTVTTTYTLSAGEGGCADSDQVTVTVRPPIRIPNAFTPNGDGRDDTWQIEFIEQFPDNTVSVFNRWGNRIFSAENYSRANEWRGDINGQPAPVGTYYYVVTTRGPLGKSYSGSITILY